MEAGDFFRRLILLPDSNITHGASKYPMFLFSEDIHYVI